MKRPLMISAIAIAIALFLTFIWMGFSVANMKTSSDYQGEKPLVLVSVEPYVFMVDQLAEGSVNVTSVIPPGVDPHNWEPTYKDMDKLKGAKVWFTIGEGFESSLGKKLQEVDPNLLIFDLNDQVETLTGTCSHACDHHHAHEVDTHTWLSPPLLIQQARFITEILELLSPQSEDLFKNNFLKLQSALEKLDISTANELVSHHGEILVTTHGAYTYYCHDYGLKQVVIEPSSGKEPRLRDITELVKKLRAEKETIIGIFLQPQHTNKAAKLISKDLDIPTHTVDPYAPNFIQTIKRLNKAVLSSNAQKKPEETQLDGK